MTNFWLKNTFFWKIWILRTLRTNISLLERTFEQLKKNVHEGSHFYDYLDSTKIYEQLCQNYSPQFKFYLWCFKISKKLNPNSKTILLLVHKILVIIVTFCVQAPCILFPILFHNLYVPCMTFLKCHLYQSGQKSQTD